MVRLVVLILILFCFKILYSRELESYLDSLYSRGRLSGNLLITDKNRVVERGSYGYAVKEWDQPFTPDTKLHIFSLTKHFTAIIVLQLVDEGVISLTDKISTYLPYLPEDIDKNIEVIDLLSHQHGIADISYNKLPLNLEELERGEFIKGYIGGGRESKPRGEFHYSGLTGYTLLGAIVEEVTDLSYEENLRSRLIEPYNLKGTGIYSESKVIKKIGSIYQYNQEERRRYFFLPQFNGASSIYSTIDDLNRLEIFLDSGEILSNNSYQILNTAIAPAEKPIYSMGYYIDRIKVGSNIYNLRFHTGGNRSSIFRVPDLGISIIFLNNIRNSELIDYSREIVQIIKE
jgi:CubicO group peptidase (beta-lactamase class C family)